MHDNSSGSSWLIAVDVPEDLNTYYYSRWLSEPGNSPDVLGPDLALNHTRPSSDQGWWHSLVDQRATRDETATAKSEALRWFRTARSSYQRLEEDAPLDPSSLVRQIRNETNSTQAPSFRLNVEVLLIAEPWNFQVTDSHFLISSAFRLSTEAVEPWLYGILRNLMG